MRLPQTELDIACNRNRTIGPYGNVHVIPGTPIHFSVQDSVVTSTGRLELALIWFQNSEIKSENETK